MRWTIRAEWTKLRTVPASWWLLAGMAAALAAIGPVLVGAIDLNRCPPGGCPADLVRLGLAGTWLAQAFAAVFGVLVATNDHATGEIVSTIVATPRRLRVAAAKAIVLASATALVGVVGGAISMVFSAMADPTVTAGWATIRAVGGTALYLAAVALIGLGAGLLVRETAWATAGILTVLHAAPIALRFVNQTDVREWLERLTPTAGLAIQASRDFAALPMAPCVALSVTAAWAGAAMVVGGGALHACDV